MEEKNQIDHFQQFFFLVKYSVFLLLLLLLYHNNITIWFALSHREYNFPNIKYYSRSLL